MMSKLNIKTWLVHSLEAAIILTGWTGIYSNKMSWSAGSLIACAVLLGIYFLVDRD